MFAYLQCRAKNSYAMESFICVGIITSFDEGASEFLFGGRPLLSESGETRLLERSIQLLQTIYAINCFLFTLRSPASEFTHLPFLQLLFLLFLMEMSSRPQSAVHVRACATVPVSPVCLAVAWEALAALLVGVMTGVGLFAVCQWKRPVTFQGASALGGERGLPELIG